MVVGGDGADEALRGVDVVEAQDRSSCPRHEVVSARVERHTRQRRRVRHRPERLLGGRFAVVEELDGEVVGAGGEDSFLRVELQTRDLLNTRCS